MNPSEMTRPPIPGMEKLMDLIDAKRNHNEAYVRCLVLFNLILRDENRYDDEFKSQYALLQKARDKVDEATLECDKEEKLREITNKMRYYGEHGVLLDKMPDTRINVVEPPVEVVVDPKKDN
jgi:hypothetical protein